MSPRPLYRAGSHSFSPAAVWFVAFLMVACLAVAALWYPVQRISQFADINYNEGWNVYKADMTARGVPLYAVPPGFTATDYPPLSFHLIGFLGKFMGGFLAAGRWIALGSLAGLAVLLALLTREFTGRWRHGIFGALLFAGALAVFLPNRVAMDDPQLLGLFWSFAGFCLYARDPRSYRLLSAGALAFALALFTKHNLISFPAAVGVHLLLERNWKRLAVWLVTLVSASAAFLVGVLHLDGPYMLQHVLAPRTVTIEGVVGRGASYILEFYILIAAALFWSCRFVHLPRRKLLVIAFLIAHVVGFAFAGGYGVDSNVLFEALIMVVVIGTISLAEIESNRAVFLLAVLGCLLGPGALLPRLVREEHQEILGSSRRDAGFLRIVDFLRAHPGPAICEDLLLCYDAGKPLLFDPYFANRQLQVGRLRQTEVTNCIQGGRFGTVEITIPPDKPLEPRDALRFSESTMRALLESYVPVVRTSEFALLTRRADPQR